jgi:hypothetical protein
MMLKTALTDKERPPQVAKTAPRSDNGLLISTDKVFIVHSLPDNCEGIVKDYGDRQLGISA